MRRFVLIAAVLAACHPGPPQQAAAGAPTSAPIQVSRIRLGVPNYGPPEVVATWHQLANYLGRRIGVYIEVEEAEPYNALPRLLAQGRVDIAELPPLAYTRLRRDVPTLHAFATPVISGSPTYLGHIYVREGSPYQTIEDLKGTRIGYVNKGSCSGFLFERDLMRSRGIDPNAFFSTSQFFESHSAVLQALTDGRIDVAAAIDLTSGWSGLLARPTGLRVIAKTERIPNDAVVAREGFDPAATEAFGDALMSLQGADPSERRLLAGLHVNGWAKADEARYDRVRAVLDHEGNSGG